MPPMMARTPTPIRIHTQTEVPSDWESEALDEEPLPSLSLLPEVPLEELLDSEIDAVPVDPVETYPFAGVYGFGRGLFVRDSLKGSDTTYSNFHRLHEGQLVMSQPKGWEGAITVVPKEFQGRFLSSVFPTFRPREDKLSPATHAAYAVLRQEVPMVEQDILMYEQMNKCERIVIENRLIPAVEAITGELN